MNNTYSIVYSSRTGNTKLLADALSAHLPPEDCRYFGELAIEAVTTDMVFVGFWTDKGTADKATLSFLKGLKNKKIFLFGTAGFAGDLYFEQILANIKAVIATDNEVVGTFMCQGKMPISVRERYEAMKEQESLPNADSMIANFDQALNHPDENDVAQLIKTVDGLK